MNTQNTSDGVLLIAGGNPHYGKMALNLLLGIKAVDGYAKVALVHDKYGVGYLTPAERALFDYCTPIDPALYMDGDKAHWGRLKCQLPALSPFDRTIFLDVDSVWFPLKRVSELFAALSGVDFTPQHSGAVGINEHVEHGAFYWAEIDDIRAAYDLVGDIYSTNSYFFYFEKTEQAARFFETAKEICDDLLSGKIPFMGWRGTVPDELCFMIATGVLGERYFGDVFKPVFEHINVQRNGNNSTLPTRNELFQNFYAGTQCGQRSMVGWRQLYDDLNTHYQRKSKTMRPYKWKDKYRFDNVVYTPETLRLENYNRMLKANDVSHDWFYLQADGTYNSVNNENFTVEQIDIIAKAGGYDTTDESGMYINISEVSPEEIHLIIV